MGNCDCLTRKLKVKSVDITSLVPRFVIHHNHTFHYEKHPMITKPIGKNFHLDFHHTKFVHSDCIRKAKNPS